MLHHILVKWTDEVRNKAALAAEVEALFQDVLAVDGVHGVTVHPNVIDRPNRYDLLIRIDMEESALPPTMTVPPTTAGRTNTVISWRRRPSLTANESTGLLFVCGSPVFMQTGA